MSAILEQQLVERGVAEAVGIVRIARMVAGILIYLIGVSAALQIFGLDLSAVIAGLGIGTAALALASQQTLGNLFGGASVLADRALTPGDTVNLGGTIATVDSRASSPRMLRPTWCCDRSTPSSSRKSRSGRSRTMSGSRARCASRVSTRSRAVRRCDR
jgi:hypothetical protein